jgi:glycosyltransferase involved in cell wall biosynthesis
MHIVIVCQVFFPDTQSTSELLTSLLRDFSDSPLKFTVITAYTENEKSGQSPRREYIGNLEIRRTGIKMRYRGSILRRGLHYLCYMSGASIELVRLRKASLVFGVTNPPFTPVWLWSLSKLFLGRYQVMLQDIYPEGLIAVGKLKSRSIVSRLWRHFNGLALNEADKIFVLGRDMRELVRSHYSVGITKIVYIPHWSIVPPATPIAPESATLMGRLDLKDKFVVQYSGNMGLWHDIDCIIRAAARLTNRNDIHFLLIGDGLRLQHAKRLASALGIRNLTWLPFQENRELHDSLSSCHLALVSQREGLQGIAVPCKLYGIMAVGRAILAMVPSGSEIDLVVREENCGHVVSPGDDDALATAILELAANRPMLQQMGLNSYNAFQRKYTVSRAKTKFEAAWSQAPIGL